MHNLEPPTPSSPFPFPPLSSHPYLLLYSYPLLTYSPIPSPLNLSNSPFIPPVSLHTHTHVGFASLAQLAHFLCSTSLVCVHHLAYTRSSTLGIYLSYTGTHYTHCVQHNVSFLCTSTVPFMKITLTRNVRPIGRIPVTTTNECCIKH